jgi:hypothetical protein
VRIRLELSPFQQRPNIEASIFNTAGKRVASSAILEASLHEIEFSMHLREAVAGSDYRFEACVYYQKLPEPGEVDGETPTPEPLVVDRQQVTFSLPLQPA